MSDLTDDSAPPPSQQVLQESKAEEKRVAIKGYIQNERINTARDITNDSRALRQELGSLCDRYNAMLADKDTLDFRLGSDKPYEDGSMSAGGAEHAYEDESKSASAEVRQLIIEMLEIGHRIRAIESF